MRKSRLSIIHKPQNRLWIKKQPFVNHKPLLQGNDTLYLVTIVMFFLFIVLCAMGSETPRLGLQEMVEGEGQPHLTINDNMWTLDAFVFPILKEYPASAANPAEIVDATNGDLFIVPTGGDGDWFGHDDDIAQMKNETWYFYNPLNGWIVTIPDMSQIRFNGSVWTELQGSVAATIIQSATGFLDFLRLETNNTTYIMDARDKSTHKSFLMLTRMPDIGDKKPNEGMPDGIYDYARLTLGADVLNDTWPDFRIHLNPIGPSWISKTLSVDRMNSPIRYYGESLAVGGAILMSATGTPPEPDFGDAVMWVDGSGYTNINSYLGVAVHNALLLTATGTPPNPQAGQAVLWVDASGNLNIKSNVGGNVATGVIFTYSP